MRSLFNSHCLHIVLILGVTALLTIPALGTTSLWDIDEGLNAEAAREMFESGDYVVPNFNFKPRTAKPPLLYWLQAGAYHAFGVNEFAARLPSVLATVLAAFLTYRFGCKMFSPVVGLLAAIILLSNVQMCVLAHAATPDAVLLACFLLTMTLFWESYASGGRHWLWITGLGCGLAALAKGPIGLLLPIAIISYFLLVQRQFYRLRDIRVFGGIALIVLIAGPWYGLIGAETHGRFLRAFWQNENVGRFLSSMEGHRGPSWYYLATVTLGLTPWCIFLGPAIWETVRCVSRGCPQQPESARSDGDKKERIAVRFLICWAAVYLGFFSLAQTKLPNYVMPIFPPVALLVARYLERWVRTESSAPHWMMSTALATVPTFGVITAACALIAGGIVFPRLMHGRAIPELAPWAVLGVIPITGGVIAWKCFRKDRRAAVLATVTGTAVIFLGSLIAGPVHPVDAQKAPKPLVEQAGACRTTEEVRVASFCYFQPSLVFYCRREVPEMLSEQEAIDFLRGPLPSYLFCPADVADALRARMPHTTVLARRRDFYKGWDVVVLSNEQPMNPTRVDGLAQIDR